MKHLFFILFLTSIIKTQAQEQFSVYFESNQSDLTTKNKVVLQTWLEQNTKSKVLSIHGFTDEDGSNAYNDSLAARRVTTIYDLIKDKIKIRQDFKTVSLGENFEQSKIKSKNRKATIFYLLEKDLENENAVLGIKTTPIVIEKPKEKVPYKYPEKIVIENYDGSKTEYKLDVNFMNELSVANKGEKIKLKNLNFVINTFAITNESRAKLYELLLVLKKRPEMIIDIQGHLCCVAEDRKDLSTKRAKAIKQFLELNGIEKNRVSYKGFGSKIPLFTIPEKNEEERAANRRVEIEILNN